MSFSSLLKQLKKRLRQKRGWLSLGIVLIFVGSAAVFSFSQDHFRKLEDEAQKAWVHLAPVESASSVDPAKAKQSAQVLNELRKSGQNHAVAVRKLYVCGEELQQLGVRTPAEIDRYLRDHPTLSIAVDEQGIVTLTDQVDDLSAKCKENAYFGLDKNGNLSLFDDLPEKDHVLRTFFQLNIEHLKSSLPREMVDQLYHGIRITDLAEYNSVLSTFSDFALNGVSKS